MKKPQIEMGKTVITKNGDGDTRTCNEAAAFSDFKKANIMHIMDVKNVMNRLSDMVMVRGCAHDITKISEDVSFYDAYTKEFKGEEPFLESYWANMHYNTERHHLNRVCPEDVNLIDVLEMLSDCVCAGMARSGNTRDVKISNEILQKALSNTQKMIEESILLIDEEYKKD